MTKKDEVELRAIVTNVTMHPKTIDFSMEDTEFDCDIDIEFYESVAYRNIKLYGVALQKELKKTKNELQL